MIFESHRLRWRTERWRYGPDALICSGSLKLGYGGDFESHQNLRVRENLSIDTTRVARGKVHYEHEVAQVVRLVSAHTFASLRHGHIPVVLGGDHSISIGSVGAALHPEFLRGRTFGLVWIDAHLDAHTHLTTPSRRAHGLPLATLLGYGPRKLLECIHSVTPSSYAGRRTRCSMLSANVIHVGCGMIIANLKNMNFEKYHILNFQENIYRTKMVKFDYLKTL